MIGKSMESGESAHIVPSAMLIKNNLAKVTKFPLQIPEQTMYLVLIFV
jgi:hypothetical protein